MVVEARCREQDCSTTLAAVPRIRALEHSGQQHLWRHLHRLGRAQQRLGLYAVKRLILEAERCRPVLVLASTRTRLSTARQREMEREQ